MSSQIDVATYVDLAAQLVGLPIPIEHRQAVIENFERIATIAQIVNEFPLTESIEIAPTFEPGKPYESTS
jgi:Protein of unknown function (DUF4089)